MRGSLLDVDYAAGAIRLTILCEGKADRVYDYSFRPYFYYAGGEAPKGFESEPVELLVAGKPRKLFKVHCRKPGEVPRAAALLREKGECFECDVPFHRRYLIDKGLEPCGGVDFEFEERDGRKVITGIARAEGVAFEPRVLAFDIETYNKRGVSTPDKDPSLTVGWADASGSGVLEQGKRGYKTEKEMLEAFAALLREKHADVVCSYNGSEFDLPFLAERAKRTGAGMRLGRDSSGVSVRRLGLRNKARLGGGRVHLDVYEAVSFLNRIGAFHLERLRLEDVYRDLLGKSKVEIDKAKIWELWEAGDKIVGEYCERDALACFEVAGLVFPQEVELARVTGATLDDASRATAGQHVEALLAREAHSSGEVLPNKPDGFAVAARERNPIEGAFVKMPEPGAYKDLMVFDFRSLYPSIIVAHNVDPTTLNCSCCRDAFVSPNGHRFCRKRTGLVPRVLGGLLEKRFALKALERKATGKEREALHARQWAFKIIANSFYGYLAYPRSRYYSRECGESVTAWARHYIQDTIAKAEGEDFKVVYADTDSVFLSLEGKSEGEALEFQKRINKELPGNMELELEDYYPRGIFVSKKQGEKGAKKKYALINREGKIKIRGFELVRRDWSPLARETQRSVLEILLKEGDAEKAAALVRARLEELKAGRVPLAELEIVTALRKKTKDYLVTSPELSAVLEARKAGVSVPEGSVIGYVITASGKNISEKARLLSRAKDYDADYYANNQVLPAVLKILGELGYDEAALTGKGKQTGLAGW